MTEGNTEDMTQDNMQHEKADFDFGWDWDAADFDAPQPRIAEDPTLPVTLEDHLIPIDRDGIYVPNHLDARGTLHFFAPVDVSDQPDFDDPVVHLRYFRVAQAEDGRLVHDSHPVMPLEHGGTSPFPLPTLQIMLEDGDLDNAQALARQTAQSHGLNFPDPATLPELNTGVDYRFVGASSDDGSPTLEAVKAWREGNQDREARLTIGSYGMSEELAVDVRELNEMRETLGLEAAMNLAETMAVAGGYLEPTRDDPRLFTDGPPDPFMTERQRELNSLYYGVGAVSANGESFLDVIKSWGEDGYERLVIPQPSWEQAFLLSEIAFTMQANGDLQGAMNLVEQAGIDAGVIDPDRDDPRLFTQGPPDPFTTRLERERAGAAITHEHRVDDAPMLTPEARAEQFRERFADSHYHLLEPVDPTVNYSFEVVAADPWTLELAADKWWIEADGRIGNELQPLKTYSMELFEWEREAEREIASMDREGLYRTYQESGLEAAMRQAEAFAVENDQLNPNRADGRLFQQGPPDRFTTLREAELAGLDAAPVRENRRDITHDDTEELPAVSSPEPDSWDALIAAQTDDEPEPERHYWQMHYRPVETPTGERLGTALFVTEFPQLPPDFDDYIEEYGMDDSIYPTVARTVEMAHFTSDDDARKFEAEFRGYLVPELLDGPELAPEVAKLEGLSGAWEEMDYWGVVGYMSGNRTIVREESDWHLHNPNAERDPELGAKYRHSGSDITL